MGACMRWERLLVNGQSQECFETLLCDSHHSSDVRRRSSSSYSCEKLHPECGFKTPSWTSQLSSIRNFCRFVGHSLSSPLPIDWQQSRYCASWKQPPRGQSLIRLSRMVYIENFAPLTAGLVGGTGGVMVITVLTRLYVRVGGRTTPGADDWVMAAAGVLATALFSIVCAMTTYGLGYHSEDFKSHWHMPYRESIYAIELLGPLCFACTKISICLTYLRIFPGKVDRTFCWAVIGFLVSWCLSSFWMAVFYCRMLMLVESVCAVGICRIWYLHLYFSKGDNYLTKLTQTPHIDDFTILVLLTAVEINFGIFCGSIPTLRLLCLRLTPGEAQTGASSSRTQPNQVYSRPRHPYQDPSDFELLPRSGTLKESSLIAKASSPTLIRSSSNVRPKERFGEHTGSVVGISAFSANVEGVMRRNELEAAYASTKPSYAAIDHNRRMVDTDDIEKIIP
ncbi:hypothetical protein K432DRAFT_439243 [Lepidopterella palustris CBS 459.81]|uniref:Rhodopsin domain-containing protein n=1 Tax=Lepidopterella palustris CBS 459.81 TaxID=1314670 RepID=A0A8E2JK68_9PEZI|nr:hypothetical protein K432DRAFT_439243 [Lepidopterella palustris CBS 459.81]